MKRAPEADLPASLPPLLIGTAGWSLPGIEQPHFAEGKSHLERYASRFPAVEINSSFYRSHRPATWARWHDTVPAAFRFSVKMPKTITHTARLEGANELLDRFLGEAGELQEKLGCILIQLPPSLSFEPRVAAPFFEQLRARTIHAALPLACEPRHATWFEPDADALLTQFEIARVAADPARVPAAADPGGWLGFSYFRLHGSPKIYTSAYSEAFLATLTDRLACQRREGRPTWCIFDNTTLGAATRNALDLTTACVGGE